MSVFKWQLSKTREVKANHNYKVFLKRAEEKRRSITPAITSAKIVVAISIRGGNIASNITLKTALQPIGW